MLPLAQQVYSNFTVIKGSSATARDLIELECSFSEQLELESNQHNTLAWNPAKIKLNNISFNYLNHAPVLSDISLTLDAHDQFIALTGDSGSGKSTIVDILAGLLHPSEGTVEIGSRVLSRQNRLSWRNRVVHVQQSPFISSSTIAENIAFQNKVIDQERINHCIDLCDLRELVTSLTDGLSTRIGLGARNLSNGQKQRIAIARAMYRDFDLLILDEALNGVDSLSVHKIISAIKNQLRPNQKLILVSHVPTHFELADLVIKVTPRGLLKMKHQG